MQRISRLFEAAFSWLLLGSFLMILARPSGYTFLIVVGVWVVNAFSSSSKLQKAFAAMNVISLFVIAASQLERLERNARFLQPQSPMWIAISAGFTIVVYLLFWSWFLQKLIRIRSVWSHLIVVVFTVALFITSLLLRQWPMLSFLLQVFAVLSVRSVWYFMFAVVDHRGRNTPFSIFQVMNPFWNYTVIPFTAEGPIDPKERISLLRSGVQLLVCCVLIRVALTLISTLGSHSSLIAAMTSVNIHGNPIETVYRGTLATVYNTDAFTFGGRWVIALGTFAFHLFSLISSVGVFIAAGRMCGIPVFRFIYRPFASRTFYETLSRANYHYVQMINKLLMNPMMTSLKLIKSAQVRIPLAAFLSIFCLGFVYHILKWTSILFSGGLAPYLNRYVGYSVYFFLVAFSAAVSIAFTLRWPPSPEPNWKLYLRNAAYFVVYSFIFSFIAGDYTSVPSVDHIRFGLSLLGIKF